MCALKSLGKCRRCYGFDALIHVAVIISVDYHAMAIFNYPGVMEISALR